MAACHTPEIAVRGHSMVRIAQSYVRARNGEPKDAWTEPESIGLNYLRFCRPRSLIFLEQQQTPCFRLRRLSATESAHRLERRT